MSKKVKLSPAAAVVPEAQETRDIKAEQASAQMSLSVQQEIEKQQREADQRVMDKEKQGRTAEEARMVEEAEQRHQAELRVPLTEAEGLEKDRLERQAMGPGNMDPLNMHRLRDLRIRSRIV